MEGTEVLIHLLAQHIHLDYTQPFSTCLFRVTGVIQKAHLKLKLLDLRTCMCVQVQMCKYMHQQ